MLDLGALKIQVGREDAKSECSHLLKFFLNLILLLSWLPPLDIKIDYTLINTIVVQLYCGHGAHLWAELAS